MELREIISSIKYYQYGQLNLKIIPICQNDSDQ